jgi:protein-S-isoprenylcysteine O-methyltransferase Ste14
MLIRGYISRSWQPMTSIKILPDFQIGILNGWLPLALYLAGFVLMVATFSRQAQARLFEDPKYRLSTSAKLVRLLGQAAMFAYIGMMVFTPLRFGTLAFPVGVLIYAGGYGVLIAALYYFRQTPADQAVVTGPYRLSRNPQWVGLVLALVGAAVMTGVLLYLGIILIVTIIYHLQILAEEKACLEQYGDSYRAYMAKVPRYFSFLSSQ